jgi:DNA-binding NarL/FixJ family response regulator
MRRTAVIVDDHAAFRRSARRVLELEGFEVVGEAADGSSGVSLVERLEPELVLLDIALPDMTGFDVAERLAHGSAAVVLTSSRGHADLGRRVRRCGAAAFVPKERLAEASLAALVEGGR